MFDAVAGDEIAVEPGMLQEHAATVRGIGGDVQTVQSAGSQVQMGREAYGMLCQIIPELLNLIQDSVVDALGTAAEALEDTADRLITAADGYTSQDEASAQNIDNVQGPR